MHSDFADVSDDESDNGISWAHEIPDTESNLSDDVFYEKSSDGNVPVSSLEPKSIEEPSAPSAHDWNISQERILPASQLTQQNIQKWLDKSNAYFNRPESDLNDAADDDNNFGTNKEENLLLSAVKLSQNMGLNGTVNDTDHKSVSTNLSAGKNLRGSLAESTKSAGSSEYSADTFAEKRSSSMDSLKFVDSLEQFGEYDADKADRSRARISSNDGSDSDSDDVNIHALMRLAKVAPLLKIITERLLFWLNGLMKEVQLFDILAAVPADAYNTMI